MTTVVTTIEMVTTVTFATTGPQGVQGEVGPQGASGRPLTLRGTVPSAMDLPEVGNQGGDAFITTDTTHIYVWSGAEWVDGGSIRGPQGVEGEVGSAGRAFTLRGAVATIGDLPSNGNEPGDAFIAADTGHLHGWNGSEWVDGGSVRGEQGVPGVGLPGRPFTLRGMVATADNLPIVDNQPGDAFITGDDGHLHAWDGEDWIDGGQIRGEQGPQGDPATVVVVAGEGVAVTVDGEGNPVVSLDGDAQAALAEATSAVQPESLAGVATSGSYNDLTGAPIIDDGTSAAVQHPLHFGTDFTKPYVYINTGSVQNGGRIIISTAAPSGTPVNGEIWIQREP